MSIVAQHAATLKTQLQALEKSVAKWNIVVKSFNLKNTTHVNEGGTRDCECCKKFYKAGCRGCPISLHTRVPSCRGTPYTEWSNLVAPARMSGDAEPLISKDVLHARGNLVRARLLATEERAFLQNLLKIYKEKVKLHRLTYQKNINDNKLALSELKGL